MANFIGAIRADGLTAALDRRDGQFGDYRTTGQEIAAPSALPDAPIPASGTDYSG
jgi:hypothetical protein